MLLYLNENGDRKKKASFFLIICCEETLKKKNTAKDCLESGMKEPLDAFEESLRQSK